MADRQQMYRNKGGQRLLYRPDGSSLIKQKGREINMQEQCNYCFSDPLDRLAEASVEGKDKVTSLLSQRKGE